MTELEHSKVNAAIHNIGLLNNLTDKQVKEIIEAQFRFTYEKIKSLQLEGLSDEEIDNLKTNFYFKYLGKLYTNSRVIRNHKLKEEIVKQKYEENEKRNREYQSGS